MPKVATEGFTTGLRLCELRFLAIFEDWPACDGDCQGHHVVNRSKVPKGSARKFMEDHWEIFGADICPVHNVGRYADTPAAVAYLVHKRIKDLGAEYVSSVWEEWKKHWKAFPPEFEISAILSKLPQEP